MLLHAPPAAMAAASCGATACGAHREGEGSDALRWLPEGRPLCLISYATARQQCHGTNVYGACSRLASPTHLQSEPWLLCSSSGGPE